MNRFKLGDFVFIKTLGKSGNIQKIIETIGHKVPYKCLYVVKYSIPNLYDVDMTLIKNINADFKYDWCRADEEDLLSIKEAPAPQMYIKMLGLRPEESQPKAVTRNPKCECGSESVGSIRHSSWCPKSEIK